MGSGHQQSGGIGGSGQGAAAQQTGADWGTGGEAGRVIGTDHDGDEKQSELAGEEYQQRVDHCDAAAEAQFAGEDHDHRDQREGAVDRLADDTGEACQQAQVFGQQSGEGGGAEFTALAPRRAGRAIGRGGDGAGGEFFAQHRPDQPKTPRG